jgi:hypothetical protein
LSSDDGEIDQHAEAVCKAFESYRSTQDLTLYIIAYEI